MLNLIFTDSLQSEPITDAVKASYGLGGNHLIIVPDRFTLSYERAVLDALNIQGAFDIEVASFSRLADVALQEGNKGALNSLSEVMLLRKVIEESRSELNCFRTSSAHVGFCSEFYAALSQIRSSGVSSQMLNEAVSGLSGKVALKTKDVALLYGRYIEGLGGLKDNASKLEYLCGVVQEGRYIDYNVYISDFTGFSKIELDIISAFLGNCKSVTLCIPYSKSSGGGRIYPIAAVNRIKEAAAIKGVGVKESSVSYLKGDFAAIRENLFAYTGNKCVSDGSLSLMRCNDSESELRAVARRIKEEVNLGGMRYRDFAVVCCDAERYGGIVHKVFSDFGIPAYFDTKTALSSTAAAKILTCGIRAVLKKFRRREMIELSKCLLLGIDSDSADAFENYCLKYNIDYTLFSRPFTIEDAYLDAAERVRARIASALDKLAPLSGKGDAVIFGKCVASYLDFIDFNRRLNALSVRQSEEGFASAAAVSAQCSDKLSSIVSECAGVFGGEIIEGELYYEVLLSAIEAQEISTVPLFLDCVYVGQIGESRYENCKSMFVVGAEAGLLPAESGDSGMISGRECEAWRRVGIEVEPDAAGRNNAAKLSALMTLVKPTSRLCISYTVSGGDCPSSAVRELSAIFSIPVKDVIERPDEIDSRAVLARYIGGRGNSKGALTALTGVAREGGASLSGERMNELYSYVCGVYGKEYTDALIAPEENLRRSLFGVAALEFSVTSVSRLEKYMKCPFMHYADYILKLKERDEARLNVRDLGTLMHGIMEGFFGGRYRKGITPAEIEECVSEISSEILSGQSFAYLAKMPNLGAEIKSIQDRCVFSLIKLCDKMSSSSFVPCATERGFGAGEFYPPVAAGDVTLRGVIDRIDRWGDRIAVIDYKSSSKVDFSPKEVIFGQRIQTFIYLRAAMSEQGVKPAGVFYLPFGGGYKDENKDDERLRYSGFITSDPATLYAFDSEAADSLGKSRLYPIKYKSLKSGEVKIEAGKGGVMTDDSTLMRYCDYAVNLAGQAAKEIAGGFITPSPVGKACEYCAYASLCDKGSVRARNIDRYSVGGKKEGGDDGLE